MAEHVNIIERAALFDLVMMLEREHLLGPFSGDGPQYEVTIKVKRIVHDEYSIDASRELVTLPPVAEGPPPWADKLTTGIDIDKQGA